MKAGDHMFLYKSGDKPGEWMCNNVDSYDNCVIAAQRYTEKHPSRKVVVVEVLVAANPVLQWETITERKLKECAKDQSLPTAASP